MKKIVISALLALLATPVMADQYVKGYTRSDGTYVQGYVRSTPNSYRYDNYSSQGNINPYSGKSGEERHEYSNNPQWNNSYGGGAGKNLNQQYGG